MAGQPSPAASTLFPQWGQGVRWSQPRLLLRRHPCQASPFPPQAALLPPPGLSWAVSDATSPLPPASCWQIVPFRTIPRGPVSAARFPSFSLSVRVSAALVLRGQTRPQPFRTALNACVPGAWQNHLLWEASLASCAQHWAPSVILGGTPSRGPSSTLCGTGTVAPLCL